MPRAKYGPTIIQKKCVVSRKLLIFFLAVQSKTFPHNFGSNFFALWAFAISEPTVTKKYAQFFCVHGQNAQKKGKNNPFCFKVKKVGAAKV